MDQPDLARTIIQQERILALEAELAEERRLAAFLAEERDHYQQVVIDMGTILEHAVNVLRGAPPDGCGWSTHDVATLAAKAAAVANAIVAYQHAPDAASVSKADAALKAAVADWRGVQQETVDQRNKMLAIYTGHE